MAGVACFPAGSRRGLERARQRVRTAASVSLCVHRRSPGAGASLLQKGGHAPRTGPLLLELQGPLRLGVLAGLVWAWWVGLGLVGLRSDCFPDAPGSRLAFFLRLCLCKAQNERNVPRLAPPVQEGLRVDVRRACLFLPGPASSKSLFVQRKHCPSSPGSCPVLAWPPHPP